MPPPMPPPTPPQAPGPAGEPFEPPVHDQANPAASAVFRPDFPPVGFQPDFQPQDQTEFEPLAQDAGHPPQDQGYPPQDQDYPLEDQDYAPEDQDYLPGDQAHQPPDPALPAFEPVAQPAAAGPSAPDFQPVTSRRALREAEAAEAAAARQDKPGRWRGPITAAVVLVLVAAVGSVGWLVGKPLFDDLTKPKPTQQTDYPGPGEGAATITIDPGDVGSVIGDKLVAAGVVATTEAFVEAWNKAGDRANSIQPGTYALLQKMTAADALAWLLDPARRNAISFTVPEGKRADEVYQVIGAAMAKTEFESDADQAAIDQAAAERSAEVQQAAADAAAIGLPPEANGLVEGWLFPETYSFNIDTEPTAILAQMVAQTVAVLEELQVPRERWLETLTVASIIERETKLSPDRPKMAQLIMNRLERGQKLELDSTVVYGVRRFDQNLATTDAERQDANPWNTYVIPGLPAGPICNPGRETIEAYLAPEPGGWLYVCATNPDTGEVEFNETIEGHQQCVAKWQAWERDQAG
jgi:UPF0755 protein